VPVAHVATDKPASAKSTSKDKAKTAAAALPKGSRPGIDYISPGVRMDRSRFNQAKWYGALAGGVFGLYCFQFKKMVTVPENRILVFHPKFNVDRRYAIPYWAFVGSVTALSAAIFTHTEYPSLRLPGKPDVELKDPWTLRSYGLEAGAVIGALYGFKIRDNVRAPKPSARMWSVRPRGLARSLVIPVWSIIGAHIGFGLGMFIMGVVKYKPWLGSGRYFILDESKKSGSSSSTSVSSSKRPSSSSSSH